MSFNTTNSIKGIFIALVFISHVTPYILKSGYIFDADFLDRSFLYVNSHIGQWIVAMFLFYSGYGVMESIKKKGKDYIDAIPRKRVLTTLINFDIAVVLFVLIALITSKDYSLTHYLLSLTAWESVGNSNWYIFVIMLCYLITYVSFRNNHINNVYMKGAFICALLGVVSMFALSCIKSGYWYDTMLCFVFGIYYSLYREKIEVYIKRHYWLILPIVIILLFLLANTPFSVRGLKYNVFSIVFCVLIIMLSMKIKINNNILIWSGKNLFPLYIYQRVPMIILSTIYGGAFVSCYPVLYASVCLLITLLFAYFYKYWSVKL